MQSLEQGPQEDWDNYTDRLVAGADQRMPLWMSVAIDPDEDYWEMDESGIRRWSDATVGKVASAPEFEDTRCVGDVEICVTTWERVALTGERAGNYERQSSVLIGDHAFTPEAARIAAQAMIEAAALIEAAGD